MENLTQEEKELLFELLQEAWVREYSYTGICEPNEAGVHRQTANKIKNLIKKIKHK